MKETPYSTLIKYFTDRHHIDVLSGQQKAKTTSEKMACKYFVKLGDISSIMERVGRYDIYYKEFYIDESIIPKHEALEYHIQSYLDNLYRLQERMFTTVNLLKQDIKGSDIEKDEVVQLDELLTHITTSISKLLREAREKRRKHVHIDSFYEQKVSLVKSLSLIEDTLDPVQKELVQIKKGEILEEVQNRYIKLSVANKETISALSDFFFTRLGFVYSLIENNDPSNFSKFFQTKPYLQDNPKPM